MRKIIIDCDNTFGIKGCDLDDGLAIIYALGCGNCDVLGITTTFGNNTLEYVYPNTIQFMKRIGMPQIPVFQGHTDDFKGNEAARFIVDMANRFPNELSILATGSLTNLYHAFLIDNTLFEKIDEISLMGGITEPLVIGGKVLDELNFSCNYRASFHVLTNGRNIKIATGNNCLDALFLKKDFDVLKSSDQPFLQWLHGQAQYWFEREKDVFGHDGIYKWDIYAAAALLNPHLFEEQLTCITPDFESLKTGFLLGAGTACTVNLPKIKDVHQYVKHIYDTYDKFANLTKRRTE